MDVSATSSAASTAASSARQTLSSNYDTFLKLLTAQLQNQDPLSPMDSTQFTQQLVMYSQVEQQITTNDNLSSLIALQKTAAGANAVSYLGRTAFTQGAQTSLVDGAATWRYTLPNDAASVTINVQNANGRTVYTTTGDANLGDHDFSWDGQNNAGVAQQDGTYTLSIAAKDASGKTLTPTITGIGVVKEVDMSGTEPTVTVGARAVSLGEIVGLKN
ncbi:MAG: flagellar hook assembly protein FlgD [Alphaproteobacteria bacterium]|nr:flagellar hook assembly protein FlgD [Alphaproteobacteria bacterium]